MWACGAGAGTFGAQTVTLAKSTAEILKTTFNGDNQFVYLLSCACLARCALGCCSRCVWSQVWVGLCVLTGTVRVARVRDTDVIVLSMFGTIFLEQHWLASGLVHFDALYVPCRPSRWACFGAARFVQSA